MSAGRGGGTAVAPREPGAPSVWQTAATLVAAVDLGVLGDALLRAPGPPGLNLALWAGGLTCAVVVLARRRDALSTEAAALLGAAMVFAGAMVWRDSPILKLLDFAAIAACFGLVAYRQGEPWLRGAGLLQYAGAALATGLSGAFGGVGLASEVDWRRAAMDSGTAWRRQLSAVGRGLALALPVLAVFGALLAGADAIFAQLLSRTLRLDVGRLVSHVVLTGFFAWVAGGYLRQWHMGAPAGTGAIGPVRPRLGIVEVAVPLALLDLLFAAFMIVQVRYFFGGDATVQATGGLTYAQYARQGFFELVAVAALVLPLLLGAETLLERRGPGDEWLFRGLAGTQLVLVLAIMVSALQRMRLYQATYGLTEDRLYATAFMGWLAVVSIWLAATVLAGRKRRFAFGALVTAGLAAGVLNLVNPDALVARVNLGRAVRGERFDAAYLPMLSGDAVPELVAGLRALPPEGRCTTEGELVRRWLRPTHEDWRTWNVDRARARATVRALVRRESGCWRPAEGRLPTPASPPDRDAS